MGADLYIEKIHHPLMQKYGPLFEAAVQRRNSLPPKSREAETAQEEVTKYYGLMYSEGYFRDSYNVTNVLNRLGLSWWEDVIPLCTKNRKLRHDKLRKFRDMVVSAKLALPSKEDLEKQCGTIDDTGENSLSEWHKYFVGKQAALIVFLNKAIELNSAVYCSL
jgi:hypothetical protein